ncbi:MAG: hypothetical protein NTU94_09530 [Planctomycetota bacterium]|nr:hypothetical protein [Planctomycetota bacterium]
MQARLLKFLAVVVILGAAGATALADLSIEAIGDMQPTGSWSQAFRITDLSHRFDLLDIRLTSSDAFESPAVDGLNNGWDNVRFGTTEAAADGPATYSEKFTITIAGDAPRLRDPVKFDVLAFPQGGYMADEVVHVWLYVDPPDCWTPQLITWSDCDSRINRDEVIRVPAPAAIGLGVLGLALVGWLKRRVA